MVKGRLLPLLSVLLLLSSSALLFQNCSDVRFADEMGNGTLGSSGIVVEDGASATNKKLLKVDFVNLKGRFSKMRIAEERLWRDDLPWTDFQASSLYDLAAQFSGDGTRDDVKKIKAELKFDGSPEALTLDASILLDTLPPVATPLDLLAQGLRGEVMKKGQSVRLKWNAMDPVAPTGMKSDLHPRDAIYLGWSKQADCSNANLVDKTAPMPNSNQYDGFKWPVDKGLETFYVCIFVSDLAGNRSTLLSQPMTSLWEVVAGENNIGNGGSVTSPSVRFNYLQDIEADSEGNLFIYDSYYGQLRKLDYNNEISILFGNGINVNPSKNEAFSVRSMSVDSRDRLYALIGGSVVRFTPNATKTAYTRESISKAISGLSAIFIKQSSAAGIEDQVYLGHYITVGELTAQPAAKATAESYVFSMSLSELESKGSTLSLAMLKASHRVAGSGSTLFAGSAASSDPRAFASPVGQDPMGYVTTIFVDDNEDLFIGTTADGGGRPYGDHAIRLVRKDANGVPTNYRFVSTYYWANDIKILHANGARTMLLSGSYRIRALALDAAIQKSMANRAPIPDTDMTTPWGANRLDLRASSSAIVYKKGSLKLPQPEVYVNHTSGGQINLLDAQLGIVAAYGRKPFSKDDKVALLSALNNPSAVVQDKRGDLFIFDALNCLLRRVDAQNTISSYAGEPCSVPNSGNIPSLDKVDLSSGYALSISYRFPLAYNAREDKLWIALGNTGHLGEFNLGTKSYKLSSFGASSSASTSTWPTYGLSLYDGAKGVELLISRNLTINPFGQKLEMWSPGVGVPAPFAGNGSIGTAQAGPALQTPLGAPFATAIDAANGDAYFVSDRVNLFRARGGQLELVKKLSFAPAAMTLFRSGDEMHLLSVDNAYGLNHAVLNTAGQVIKEEKLCFTGSYLNNPQSVSVGQDGNLLIADTYNNRILKYYVRNPASQSLEFHSCP